MRTQLRNPFIHIYENISAPHRLAPSYHRRGAIQTATHPCWRRSHPSLPAGFSIPQPDPHRRTGKIQPTFKEKQDAIINVLNIHNPSIEVHLAPNDEKNTGTAIILAPGGGHKILWVEPEGAKWIPYFAKLGISTIILRNRLRIDGYEPTTDATYDAQQAIRIVRSRATEWKIDPNKIGIMGFSAGAELAAPCALFFEEFQKKNSSEKDPLAKISARPDFIGIIYPGPTPFTRDPSTKIPANVPPAFIACSGSTDKIHAIWAADYFNPMLLAGVPNVEMHIYARGGHGSPARGPNEIPYASWPDRLSEWLGDLGFLGKPGEPTRAAKDSAAFAVK